MGAQAVASAGWVPCGGVYYRRPFSDLKRARPFLNESATRPTLPVVIPRAEHPVSRAQIARQLGTPVEVAPIASSFAEIERALH